VEDEWIGLNSIHANHWRQNLAICMPNSFNYAFFDSNNYCLML